MITLMEERIGSVIKFFDKTSIAAVKLDFGDLAMGDSIHVKGNDTDFTQKIEIWNSTTIRSRKPSAASSSASSFPRLQSPSILYTRSLDKRLAMLIYFIKRTLLMIPILLGITVLSFGVMRLAPGGPAEAQMEFSAQGISRGAGASPQALRR